MARRLLTREEYTVGWVCALPIELAAAKGMLDEEHESHSRVAHDDNVYVLGSIAGHNIVVGCLPAGQTGNSAATAVASRMQGTYRGIQFGLMVGIGSGVPTEEADIRLGDVVVSQPHKTHGGVVQYDLGKNTPDGFVRTGHLNAPPTLLLNAINHIRANAYLGQTHLLDWLGTLEKIPTFARASAGADVLYTSEYNHEGGATCELCRVDQQVDRDDRRDDELVVVHYGTIASGNRVMRDGKERDRISAELGSVLCFEEAGLMNSFPCLVVRGICDYADSHQNEEWQPYAAAVAAAYAKEVLVSVPIADVPDVQTINQDLGNVGGSWIAPRTVAASADLRRYFHQALRQRRDE